MQHQDNLNASTTNKMYLKWSIHNK